MEDKDRSGRRESYVEVTFGRSSLAARRGRARFQQETMCDRLHSSKLFIPGKQNGPRNAGHLRFDQNLFILIFPERAEILAGRVIDIGNDRTERPALRFSFRRGQGSEVG